MITIQLNGQPYDTAATTLAQLVAELGLTGQRFALEMQGALVPKSQLATTLLLADQPVEIVRAVGGG